MERKVISFILLAIVLVACDKPNPEPEKLDPIYASIEKEIKEMEAAISGTEKAVQEAQENYQKAVPQTGQIKFALKRLNEAKAALEKQRQMKQYWELRLKSRLRWDREHYLRAYNKKEPWPPPEEYEEYRAQRALESASRNWKNSERIEAAAIRAPKPTEAPKH
jgi:hypothetical protein